MSPITYSQVCEVFPHRFVTEASTLGWPPGSAPSRIPTEMGNRQPLVLTGRADDRWTYAQRFGCIELVVFND